MRKFLLMTTLFLGGCGQEPVPVADVGIQKYPANVVEVCSRTYKSRPDAAQKCMDLSIEPRPVIDPKNPPVCGQGCREQELGTDIRMLEWKLNQAPSYSAPTTITYPTYKYVERPFSGAKPFIYRTTETITVR